MSLNFGTDNVYYVPEGEKLAFYDIYHMRRVGMDFSLWNVFYNNARIQYVKGEINNAWRRWSSTEKDPQSVEHARKTVHSFLEHLPVKRLSPRDQPDPTGILAPQDIYFWVKFSDRAVESFYPEDYPVKKRKTGKKASLPVIGSFYLSSIGDFELNIHEGVEERGFILEIPETGGIVIENLPPEQILPLDESFFGAFGSSGRGRVVNLSHDSSISRENMCCTPLHKIARDFFVTLYFHVATSVIYDVMLSFPEKSLTFIRALLGEIGFKPGPDHGGNRVYSRGQTHVQLYSNAAGKETLGSRFLKPFLLVTSYENSTDPSDRSKLMEELIPRLKK